MSSRSGKFAGFAVGHFSAGLFLGQHFLSLRSFGGLFLAGGFLAGRFLGEAGRDAEGHRFPGLFIFFCLFLLATNEKLVRK
jgi:hypothetical protein